LLASRVYVQLLSLEMAKTIGFLSDECNLNHQVGFRNPLCATFATVTRTQRYNNPTAIPVRQPLFPTVPIVHHQQGIQAG